MAQPAEYDQFGWDESLYDQGPEGTPPLVSPPLKFRTFIAIAAHPKANFSAVSVPVARLMTVETPRAKWTSS